MKLEMDGCEHPKINCNRHQYASEAVIKHQERDESEEDDDLRTFAEAEEWALGKFGKENSNNSAPASDITFHRRNDNDASPMALTSAIDKEERKDKVQAAKKTANRKRQSKIQQTFDWSVKKQSDNAKRPNHSSLQEQKPSADEDEYTLNYDDYNDESFEDEDKHSS